MYSNQYVYKGTVFVFIFFSFLVFSNDTQAVYQTNLSAGVYIQNSGIDLDVWNWSAPTVYDWNSDGKKDLLVGRKDASNIGHVSLYTNIGTDASPVFNGYTDIQTCGAPCTNGGG
jgi:hypothetical protein